MNLTEKDKARFWAKVLIKGQKDCWEWQAGKTKYGHGVFSIKSKWIGAHVVSFFIKNKYVPKFPELVMHHCENPACTNPAHLLKGDAKLNGNYPGCVEKCRINIRNRSFFGLRGKDHVRWGKKHSEETKKKISVAAKKRGGWHKGFKRSEATKEKLRLLNQGEKHPRSKLTSDAITKIFYDQRRNVVIAKDFGVDPSIVSCIKRRTIWKHITLGLR